MIRQKKIDQGMMVMQMYGKNEKPSLEFIFQKWLLVLVVAAFVITFGISYFLQNRQAIDHAHNLLTTELHYLCRRTRDSQENYDVLKTKLDADLVDKADTFALMLKLQPQLAQNMEMLKTTCTNYGLLGVDITDATGMVVASYPTNYIGKFDFKANKSTRRYMPLIKNQDDVVIEEPRLTLGNDNEGMVKNVGVARIDAPGIIQVRFPAESYMQYLSYNSLKNMLHSYHIGTTGQAFLLNNHGVIISATESRFEGQHYAYLGLLPKQLAASNGFLKAPLNGKDCIVGFDHHEDYTLLVFYPEKEAFAKRNELLVWNAVLYLVLFFFVYILISMLLQSSIIKNIFSINDSLEHITEGNLNEEVQVTDYKEFAILSTGINNTVDALKEAIAAAAARIDKELEFAKAIQVSALPAVFPPYPKIKAFDIYASMRTAKEVGGDFYDLFLVGDKLGFVMADVSGKGIPAALFMMTAKTQIKNGMERGMDLAEEFTRINEELCANNDANMFVTVFAGLLDYQTGELQYVNAGHNKPLIRHNGTYEWLMGRSGLPMAAMSGLRYKMLTTKLEPGDMFFTYTDGVTEATNAKEELYSDPRLIDFLNAHSNIESVQGLLKAVDGDVRRFQGTAEQADDITMLAVRLNEEEEEDTSAPI